MKPRGSNRRTASYAVILLAVACAPVGGWAAVGVTVDTAGNTYIASAGPQLIRPGTAIVVKHDVTGNVIWATCTPTNRGEETEAVSLDAAGNVYDTRSYRFATFAYGRDGTPLWRSRYEGFEEWWAASHAARVTGAGVTVATGTLRDTDSYFSDILTLAYAADGEVLWSARREEYATESWGNALTVDPAGNVYVAGVVDDGEGSPNWCILRYDAAGRPGVTNFIPGEDGEATDIAADADGNAWVTGFDRDESGHFFRTIYFDAGGREVWRARTDEGSFARVYLAVDPSHLFISGTVIDFGGDKDRVLTVAYSKDGDELWSRSFSAAQSVVRALAIIPGGVVAAGSAEPDGEPSRVWLVAYSAAGNESWRAEYAPTAPTRFTGFDFAVDGDGDVFVAGSIHDAVGELGPAGVFLVKFDSAGNELWAKEYGPDDVCSSDDDSDDDSGDSSDDDSSDDGCGCGG